MLPECRGPVGALTLPLGLPREPCAPPAAESPQEAAWALGPAFLTLTWCLSIRQSAHASLNVFPKVLNGETPGSHQTHPVGQGRAEEHMARAPWHIARLQPEGGGGRPRTLGPPWQAQAGPPVLQVMCTSQIWEGLCLPLSSLSTYLGHGVCERVVWN